MLEAAALIVLFAPLAGLLAAVPFYVRRSKLVAAPILVSSALAVAASWTLAAAAMRGSWVSVPLWDWVSVGGISVRFGVYVDGLSAAVLAMASLVSLLIHIYAVGYMADDDSFGRFFLFFHFFFFSMVGLLTAPSYFQLYMFWEGVGLASFLLIGFWYGKESARKAALKAFITNRVGDVGFLLAFLLLGSSTGTLEFQSLWPALGKVEPGRLTTAGLLLLWGATAKSAQVPLYIWLPDAMEGPTPVSALMHAATMVTAGVFLMLRSLPLLEKVPHLFAVLAAIGALTALLGALVGSVKTDLKKILAYSTMSHLGLMMLSIGLGLYTVALFHLIVHGFFKACLFLCAGNVLHAVGKPAAEIEDVGGLRRSMKWTYAAFLAAAVSLSGALPVGGFYSKDRIIGGALEKGVPLLKAAAVLTTIFSAYYIFRLAFLTFLGEPSEREGRPHEAPAVMLVPVLLLAVGSLAAGALGAPISALMGRPLGPEVELAGALLGMGLAWVGVLGAWLGVMARKFNARRPAGAFGRTVSAEFGWQALLVGIAGAAEAFARALGIGWDQDRWNRWIESLPQGVIELADAGAQLSRGLLNDYLWWLLAGAGLLAWVVR